MPRTRPTSHASRTLRRQQRRERGRNTAQHTVCVVSGCTLKVVKMPSSFAGWIHTVIIPGGLYNLATITATLPTVVYKPNAFPGATTKIELPNGKSIIAMFFSSGRLDFFGEIPPDYVSELIQRFLAIFQITLPYVDAKPTET